MTRENLSSSAKEEKKQIVPSEQSLAEPLFTDSQQSVLSMQQQQGNHAVVRMMQSQAKSNQRQNTVQREPQINTDSPPTKVPEKREVYAAGLFLPGEFDAKVADWYNGNDAAFDGSFDKVFPTFVKASLLGVSVAEPVHPKMAEALKNAEDKLKALNLDNTKLAARGFSIDGIGSDTNTRGGTSMHALGLAIDIDSGQNPYVLRERLEGGLDKELIPIYNRIALFTLGKTDSVITRTGGIADTKAKTADPKRAADMYDELFSESQGMKFYFQLMGDAAKLKQFLTQDPTQPGSIGVGDLGGYTTSEKTTDEQGASTVTDTRHGVTVLNKPMAELVKSGFGLELTPTNTDEVVKKIQAQMAADWSWLTNKKADLSKSAITDADVTKAPDTVKDDSGKKDADKPFKSTTPLGGFMNIDPDVVQALVSSGLAWGGTDLGPDPAHQGGGSGDIMHFDLRTQFNRFKFDPVVAKMAAALKGLKK